MNSLLLRLAALCVLLTALATVVCAWSAARATLAALGEQEAVAAQRAAEDFRRRLDQVLRQLEFEVGDYAHWDELYEHAPHPVAEWARVNLPAGTQSGRLTQVMVLIDGERVASRHGASGPRGPGGIVGDPAAPAQLLELVRRRAAQRGLAWLDGHPALFAWEPIVRSDLSGPPRGILMSLAYIDERTRARMDLLGWNWTILKPGTPVPETTAETARVGVPLQAADAELPVLLERSRAADEEVRAGAVRAIAIAGLATSLLAALVGALLCWWWLRPLRRLAEACRLRAGDPATPLPDGGDLDETRILAEELRGLVDAERAARARLEEELRRAETARSLQGRMLAQLAHDFGRPVHELALGTRRLADSGGLVTPEDANRLAAAADEVLLRLHDAVGLSEGGRGERPARAALGLHAYAEGIAALITPQAGRRGVRLAIDAPATATAIDASLVTPVLVNLLANAVRACPAGTEVRLTARLEEGILAWEVADQGGGIADELAARIRAACDRGETIPGEPGIGLGLAVAVGNATRASGRLGLVATGPAGTRFRLELPR